MVGINFQSFYKDSFFILAKLQRNECQEGSSANLRFHKYFTTYCAKAHSVRWRLFRALFRATRRKFHIIFNYRHSYRPRCMHHTRSSLHHNISINIPTTHALGTYLKNSIHRSLSNAFPFIFVSISCYAAVYDDHYSLFIRICGTRTYYQTFTAYVLRIINS